MSINSQSDNHATAFGYWADYVRLAASSRRARLVRRFDAVVAENGAVLAFPRGRTRLLGRSPSQVFLEAALAGQVF